MRKPKIRELKEAITSLFSRPFTTDFPYKPASVVKRYRGKPKYNEDICVGCGGCFQVCPAKAIEMVDDLNGEGGPTRTLIHHPAQCIFCGECQRNCITKEGIKLTTEFEISYFDEKTVTDSVKHKLLVCKHCGEVIGTEKHIMFVFKKLGSLAFSQPVTISRLMEELEIKGAAEEKFLPPIQRTDMLKIVCPKCRRLAFITDEKKER